MSVWVKSGLETQINFNIKDKVVNIPYLCQRYLNIGIKLELKYNYYNTSNSLS